MSYGFIAEECAGGMEDPKGIDFFILRQAVANYPNDRGSQQVILNRANSARHVAERLLTGWWPIVNPESDL